MSTIPQTGEQLPDYDDERPEGVDINAVLAWLEERYPGNWGTPDHFDAVNQAIVRAGHRRAISLVLAAFQAIGDATLVKNGTYRMMRQDGNRVERLAARLANTDKAGLLIEHGGDPVSATLAILDAFDITRKTDR